MNYSTYLVAILIAFTILINRSVPAPTDDPDRPIQCKTCSEDAKCSESNNPSNWDNEECPESEKNCNLVWEQPKDRPKRLIYGGCANNRISLCSSSPEETVVCIETCEGHLCNQHIDIEKERKVVEFFADTGRQ